MCVLSGVACVLYYGCFCPVYFNHFDLWGRFYTLLFVYFLLLCSKLEYRGHCWSHAQIYTPHGRPYFCFIRLHTLYLSLVFMHMHTPIHQHTHTHRAHWQVISPQSNIAEWREQMLSIQANWAEYQRLSRSYNTNEQCDGSHEANVVEFLKDRFNT